MKELHPDSAGISANVSPSGRCVGFVWLGWALPSLVLHKTALNASVPKMGIHARRNLTASTDVPTLMGS